MAGLQLKPAKKVITGLNEFVMGKGSEFVEKIKSSASNRFGSS